MIVHSHNYEDPAAQNAAGSPVGLERREVEKRRKDQRLTASAVFHEFRIKDKYVNTMTDSVRNCELPINESLKLDVLREGLLPHDAPHFIDVGQRIKILVIVVVEGALQGHTVHTIRFCHEAKLLGQP